jgi:Zn-dependent protease
MVYTIEDMGGIDLLYLVIVLIVVLISMTLHEAMHAYASYWLGDDTAKHHGRLTFNPIAHIDPFATVLLPLILAAVGAPPFGAAKPVPFDPNRVKYGEYGAALVGAAGPLTNFVLAFLAFIVAILMGITIDLSYTATNLTELFLETFVTVNLAFFVFNMLPIPPLDGSRVLYAFAPEPVRRFMEMMEQYGIVVVFAIVLLFNQQLGLFMFAAVSAIVNLFQRIFGVA